MAFFAPFQELQCRLFYTGTVKVDWLTGTDIILPDKQDTQRSLGIERIAADDQLQFIVTTNSAYAMQQTG